MIKPNMEISKIYKSALGFILVFASLMACDKRSKSVSEVKIKSELEATTLFGGERVEANHSLARKAVEIDKGNGMFCTGSLIRKNIVLTAAHCVYNVSSKGMKVLVGIHLNTGKAKEIGVKDFLFPGNFDPNSQYVSPWGDFDFAVIFLKEDASPFVDIIELAPASMSLPSSFMVTLLGYGYTFEKDEPPEILRTAQVKIENFETHRPEFYIDKKNQKKGTCTGDSGGPVLFRDNEGHFFQMGIVNNALGKSALFPCGEQGAYANIFYYRKTILEWADALQKKHQAVLK